MSRKIKALKLVDAVFGRAACYLFVRPAIVPISPRNMNEVLIIRPGGIGDAVLLIPAIIALKKSHPHIVIDILSEKRNNAVFSLCPDIRRLYRYDVLTELLSVIFKKYDAVIDAEQWHRLSAVVARLTKAPISIGFATNDREQLFTHPIPYSHELYEVQSFFRLLGPLSVQTIADPEVPFLSVPGIFTERIVPLLTPLSGRKIIALFPGGSIAERRWGAQKFRELAKRFIAEGYGIVILGGKEDISDGLLISQGLSSVVDLSGKLILPETAAVLLKCNLLIAGDSGILHLSYGLGLKMVALFGPGIEKKWAPRGGKCIVINKHLPCSPCTKYGYTPLCKDDAECMKRIMADEVFVNSLKLLER